MILHPRIRARCGYSNKTSNEVKWSDVTGCLTKLNAEMEGRLGCGIEVEEDRDLGCACRFEFARNYVRKHWVRRVNSARSV